MIQKIAIGFAGALAGLAVTVLAYENVNKIFAHIALPNDTAGRLAFAARWLLLPGLCLLAGIVAAARRGFYADAIDGTRFPANHGLEINLRYNQNTLEQVVLASIAWMGLAIRLPHDRLLLIPAMAFLFVTGRITFWIGYLLYPAGRTFGMTLTILPTLAAFGWLAWQLGNSG